MANEKQPIYVNTLVKDKDGLEEGKRIAVRIIHRRDGMYDVYDRTTGKWILSRNSPDNILSWLSEKTIANIDFVDESISSETSQPIGRWIHKEGEEFSYCSVCNYPVSYMWNMTNYCPNCGIKMK